MPHKLRGAVGIGAADSRLVVPGNRAAAGRTNLRKTVSSAACALDDRKHLGNYLTRLADKHGIADIDFFLLYKIAVVKRSAAHGRTRECDRLKDSDWRKHAGSAHVYFNVKKLCEKAQRLLFMTGTAIENRVDEMISLMEVLQPDIAAKVRSMAFMSSRLTS